MSWTIIDVHACGDVPREPAYVKESPKGCGLWNTDITALMEARTRTYVACSGCVSSVGYLSPLGPEEPRLHTAFREWYNSPWKVNASPMFSDAFFDRAPPGYQDLRTLRLEGHLITYPLGETYWASRLTGNHKVAKHLAGLSYLDAQVEARRLGVGWGVEKIRLPPQKGLHSNYCEGCETVTYWKEEPGLGLGHTGEKACKCMTCKNRMHIVSNFDTHTLQLPIDCECQGDRHCSICDGGLAYCVHCKGGEQQLEDHSCAERLAVRDNFIQPKEPEA